MRLATMLFGKRHEFADLKQLLARAGDERSGDRLAGIGASSAEERAAAKFVLAEVTLEMLRQEPAVPYDEDEITRLIDDGLNEAIYAEIRHWTLGDLREWLLANETTGTMIRRAGRGMTAEMIAGVAKLMSNLDLMVAARKIRIERTANNTIGRDGTIASRLQPNHQTDSVEGIRAAVYEGLSYGSGDAVIGINPSDDSVGSVARLLEMTHEVITRWEIPTQNCVLAHVSTQMEALQKGAPLGLMFQSIAGSQRGNESFGISVGMLDEAAELTRRHGTVSGPNVMYFETGQGSELSADAHHGADQMVMEARCYGLARRYDPFLVNTVVGFIGPEYLYDAKQITRAGLEDHFMGKLSGLSMGADICYTNHARSDQNDLENHAVLLASAGVNFIMGIPMGDDSMLSYQSTSFHEIASLRQLLGIRPLPEFEEWLVEMGLWDKGQLTPIAGDASRFLERR